jgi:hypothetical protein
MFTPEADPDLIKWIVTQMSVADQEMGISELYELFRWNPKNVPSVIETFEHP